MWFFPTITWNCNLFETKIIFYFFHRLVFFEIFSLTTCNCNIFLTNIWIFLKNSSTVLIPNRQIRNKWVSYISYYFWGEMPTSDSIGLCFYCVELCIWSYLENLEEIERIPNTCTFSSTVETSCVTVSKFSFVPLFFKFLQW